MTTVSSIPAGRRVESLRVPAPPEAPEPVLLIIADISGYTRYMTANAKTLSHSQVIITELVEAIIREVELPLEVAKLEGDAIFLFCRRRDPAHSWAETRRLIAGKLLTFFRLFGDKVAELSASTTCTCNACAHIEQLRLKVIVHSGEALLYHVFNFLELAGVDVILVHRLLKNAVPADQYLLLTEAARRDLNYPNIVAFAEHSEICDGIGRVKTFVYLPHVSDAGSAQERMSNAGVAETRPAITKAEASTESFAVRFSRSWGLYRRLWFAPLQPRADPWRRTFRHIASSTPRVRRVAFALFTLALTPVLLPLTPLFVLSHMMKSVGARPRRRAPSTRPETTPAPSP